MCVNFNQISSIFLLLHDNSGPKPYQPRQFGNHNNGRPPYNKQLGQHKPNVQYDSGVDTYDNNKPKKFV